MSRVPYNKLLTNLACSSRTGDYWPSVVLVRTSRCSVRTVTTLGQYSPVRPSRLVSKRVIFTSLSRIIVYHNYSGDYRNTQTKDLPKKVTFYFSLPCVNAHYAHRSHGTSHGQNGKYFPCFKTSCLLEKAKKEIKIVSELVVNSVAEILLDK